MTTGLSYRVPSAISEFQEFVLKHKDRLTSQGIELEDVVVFHDTQAVVLRWSIDREDGAGRNYFATLHEAFATWYFLDESDDEVFSTWGIGSELIVDWSSYVDIDEWFEHENELRRGEDGDATDSVVGIVVPNKAYADAHRSYLSVSFGGGNAPYTEPEVIELFKLFTLQWFQLFGMQDDLPMDWDALSQYVTERKNLTEIARRRADECLGLFTESLSKDWGHVWIQPGL